MANRAPGRNQPCWCGSGVKYKKCHLDADRKAEAQHHRPPFPHARDYLELVGGQRPSWYELGPGRR